MAEAALLILLAADEPARVAVPTRTAITPSAADAVDCAHARAAGADCCLHPFRHARPDRRVVLDSMPSAPRVPL